MKAKPKKREKEERLTAGERRLLEQAAEVRLLAYAPYSRFRVGAALLGASGRVYRGCNVENASFGATICAERGALLQAVAAGERRFRLLALVAGCSPPAAPCGLCRQMLAEFCRDLPILLCNPRGEVLRTSLRELLPRPFRGPPPHHAAFPTARTPPSRRR